MSKLFIVVLTLAFTASSLFAQEDFPSFFNGKWRVENGETYEHWDILNEHTLKGYLYTVKEGHPVVTEYLDVTRQNGKITYTATVLNQNNGEGVTFTLNQTDSLTFSFENLNHDFPKIITYQKQSESKILVSLSDGKQKTISYLMIKQ